VRKIESIFKFIENQNITNTAFEQKAGLSNGYLRNIDKTGSNISPKMLSKINAAYPELEKFTQEIENPPPQTPTPPASHNERRVPILGEAMAGTDMEMHYSDTPVEQEYINVGDLLKDSQAAFIVYGNSMTPAYPPGCVVGIRLNLDKFIQPGETYLLVTKGNRLFKRLYYNKDRTGFKCVSDNNLKHINGPMEGEYFYPPFDIDFADVIHIYDITGMIKRNRNSGIMQRQK